MNYLLLHYQTWIQYWIVLISWFGHVVSPRLIAVSPRFQLRSRILRQKLRWFNSNKRKKLKKPKESKANAQWFRIAKTRPKQVHLMLFHKFSKANLSQIHTIFVSDHCLHFTFKTCQIVAGTSMIRQFHEFFEPIFWRFFFNLAQLCIATKLKLTIFWKGTVSLSGSGQRRGQFSIFVLQPFYSR